MNDELKEAWDRIQGSRRWVIKIGSALLTQKGLGLRHQAIQAWVEQIMQLFHDRYEIVLVSSGAVAEGITRLGWNQRPKGIHALQAAAAIGQTGLIQAWESCFQRYHVHTAQVLLTHDDVKNRERYLNARTCLRTMIKLATIPVVNENDTVATDEIRFGDNDTLAALVANLIEADLLVILTDQAGLYEKDPRIQASADLVHLAKADDPRLEGFAGQGSELGRGGMQTKIRAARMAARSGAYTIIASGLQDDILLHIARGKQQGTVLTTSQARLAARKQWLANQGTIKGELYLDEGACAAITTQGKSLLAIGVTTIKGHFERGEIISCKDKTHQEIARGLINYNASEARQIIGKKSAEFVSILGYSNTPELIHRDNLIVI